MTARRTPDDDLDQAYARAQALADGADGPSAAVRANVLAAARDIAARASTSPPDLAPVAPPVTQVGRGRAPAGNRPSWQLRSGAAFCLALLVGVVGWRWDAGHRPEAGLVVASADRAERMTPAARPAPTPAATPAAGPEVTLAPAAVADAPNVPAAQAWAKVAAPPRRLAKPAPDSVVAQADQPRVPEPTPAAVPEATARAPAARTQAPDAARTRAPDAVVAAAAPPSPVPMSPAAPAPRIAFAEAARKAAPAITATTLSAATPDASLQRAADSGDGAALRRLLADPAVQVDAPDALGATALLHAVQARQPDAVRLLLAAGADPDRADRAGLTPRAAALAAGDAAITALLPPSR